MVAQVLGTGRFTARRLALAALVLASLWPARAAAGAEPMATMLGSPENAEDGGIRLLAAGGRTTALWYAPSPRLRCDVVARTRRAGSGFGPPVTVASQVQCGARGAVDASAAVDASGAVSVASSDRDGAVRVRSQTSNGRFGRAVTVTPKGSSPALAVGARGEMVATFIRLRGSREELFVSSRSRRGRWMTARRLFTSEEGDEIESIAAVDKRGRAAVTWVAVDTVGTDACEDRGLWLARADAGGAFAQPRPISSRAGIVGWDLVFLAGGRLAVAWGEATAEDDDGCPDDPRVRIRVDAQPGRLAPPQQKLSKTEAGSPSLAPLRNGAVAIAFLTDASLVYRERAGDGTLRASQVLAADVGSYVLRSGTGGELAAFYEAPPTPDASSVLQVRLRRRDGTLAAPSALRTANGKPAVPTILDGATGKRGQASALWLQDGDGTVQFAELGPG